MVDAYSSKVKIYAILRISNRYVQFKNQPFTERSPLIMLMLLLSFNFAGGNEAILFLCNLPLSKMKLFLPFGTFRSFKNKKCFNKMKI